MSFGIAVRKEFAHGLSLESGVNYTLLRSDVRMQYSSDDVSQKLHFIGVPLRFNWQFLERGRFSLYMGAGGMVEKCVSAKLGSKTVDEPGVQWSALAAVSAVWWDSISNPKDRITSQKPDCVRRVRIHP